MYLSDKKLNLLVAYPYLTEANIQLLSDFDRSKYRLIIDSGAFTAHNSGKEIKFDEYCLFLDRIKFLKWDAAVQLDVVFNPLETHQNYQKHLERGDDVCPVFTRGDEWFYMQKLLEEDKYVFVGGVQGGSGAKEFAKYCLERSKGKRVHYLAFIRPDWLIHYRPYSVDASSWITSARFGTLHLYMGNGRMKTLERKDFVKRPSDKIFQRFKEIGCDEAMVRRLAKESSWNYGEPDSSLNVIASIRSYIKMACEAQNIIDTKIYLAMSSNYFTKHLMSCYDDLLKKGLI